MGQLKEIICHILYQFCIEGVATVDYSSIGSHVEPLLWLCHREAWLVLSGMQPPACSCQLRDIEEKATVSSLYLDHCHIWFIWALWSSGSSHSQAKVVDHSTSRSVLDKEQVSHLDDTYSHCRYLIYGLFCLNFSSEGLFQLFIFYYFFFSVYVAPSFIFPIPFIYISENSVVPFLLD